MGDRNYKLLLDSCQNIDGELLTYLHNTKTEQTAQSILKSGFQFQSHIDYSSDLVNTKDPITLKYFINTRRAYGDYTLIIQISKSLVNQILIHLKEVDNHYSEILTYIAPKAMEDDYLFQLAPQFTKGYIDNKLGIFVANPIFNPNHFPKEFVDNINIILKKG